MSKVEIYALKHPTTNEIRYIGKANNSLKRFKNHLSDSKRRKYPIYDWINKLRSEGLIPICEIIEITDSENWKDAEIRFISEYRNKGYRLLNIANGGDEPYCSKEVRADNGRKVALTIHSDEKRKKLWKLKQTLGSDFKFLISIGKEDKVFEMKAKLAQKGIYFK